MSCIVKHHIRVFISDNCNPGIGLFDDFDLAEFDNELDDFLKWFNSVCAVCDFHLDYYELY